MAQMPVLSRKEVIQRMFDIKEKKDMEMYLKWFYQIQSIEDHNKSKFYRCLKQDDSTPQDCAIRSFKDTPQLKSRAATEALSSCVERARHKSTREQANEEFKHCEKKYNQMFQQEINHMMTRSVKKMKWQSGY